ncbi:GlxA family transcriptional regulator [Micromonospora avicenniae]|uniref:Transcriptional regulator GlxA family, contains an amidase domain and an AraC-type DNA-binding HTH domain n=1 Tax=Micromonospora avicenniae TaxID=1198245 RepID=A0A1N7CGL5_9ACTN|nr:GlxA family transcriptional regulator [Micromonospora avicenniae]SIR62715.1 Transcriptional regulator GlxA family, contains an amidase domain and an AraC-type DNA-binding HTH domain [Micromonospora avicenniae]
MTGQGPHRVGVVVFDGMQLLDVSGPVDVFDAATRRGADYTVQLIGWRSVQVRTSSGVRLTADITLDEADPVDTLVLTGADDLSALPDAADVRARLGRLVRPDTRLAAVCTGAFVLARTGWLDGHPATTHWRHAERLRAEFPQVEVRPDAIYVRSGRLLTSAGVTAGIDLALALVEADHGAGPAREVARELVVFMQRPGGQSQFSVRQDLPPSGDQRLRRVIDRVAADPARPYPIEAMARDATVTPRHLRRIFQQELGLTPGRYLELARIEAARVLLEQGGTVGEAARRSGFGSDETLRRVFTTAYGIPPSVYQRRFRTTGVT